MADEGGPRVGIWGTFDVADFAAALERRILERELHARLPLATFYAYSPFGADRPIPLDCGRAAIPFGPATPRRKSEFARHLDAIVVIGDVIETRDRRFAPQYGAPTDEVKSRRPSSFLVDGLGGDLEEKVPVIWYSIAVVDDIPKPDRERVRAAAELRRSIAVIDEASRERLLVCGVDRPVDVVPPLTVLAGDVFDASVLDKRRAYLRVLGAYPDQGRPLVLEHGVLEQGNVAEAVSQVRERNPDLTVITIDSPGSEHVRLSPLFDRAVDARPTEMTLEDVAAAVAGGGLYVGASARAVLAAASLGVPTLFVDSDLGSDALAARFERPADAGHESSSLNLPQLRSRATASLDGLAELIEDAWRRRAAHSHVELLTALAEAEKRHAALLRAHGAQRERLVSERLSAPRRAPDLVASDDAEIDELRTRLEIAEGAAAAARQELERLQQRD